MSILGRVVYADNRGDSNGYDVLHCTLDKIIHYYLSNWLNDLEQNVYDMVNMNYLLYYWVEASNL